jgi:RNA polymerase sigma-70 factor, ECF subfamily
VQPESDALDAIGLGPGVEQSLAAARRGDVAAFNSLVVVHQRLVYNVCYRTLGNAEDAADATQDALLSAFRGIKAFKGPASGLRAWLLRIAVNACYDQLRRRQRRPSQSLEAPGVADAEGDSSVADRLADPDVGPEQRSLSAETARSIQVALDQLAPDQRLAVVLCDVQGLSYEEAATAMAVELGTVKSRLSRARAHLRELLTAKGELPTSSQRLHKRNS